MSKYIDADLLRKEIERRKGYISVTHFAEDLLSFLDTHSEQPVEGLEEEIRHYCKVYYNFNYPEQIGTGSSIMPHIIEAARHFAEWQKAKIMEEAVEGYVNYYENSGGILMAEAQVGCPYHNGDKVKIIIVKED